MIFRCVLRYTAVTHQIQCKRLWVMDRQRLASLLYTRPGLLGESYSQLSSFISWFTFQNSITWQVRRASLPWTLRCSLTAAFIINVFQLAAARFYKTDYVNIMLGNQSYYSYLQFSLFFFVLQNMCYCLQNLRCKLHSKYPVWCVSNKRL